MVNNLLDMAAQLDDLEAMLIEDRKDIVGPAHNLLVIHYQLNQLERFRNLTMHQAKKASANSQATLTRWFERLNKVIAEFDEYILELAKNIIPLTRANHHNVVVKLIKIAEIEGKEDEKASARSFFCCSEISPCNALGRCFAICQESGQARCRPQVQISAS